MLRLRHMTREEIKNKVVAIVADKIGFFQNEISESTRFKADLGTDSLDDIDLLMEFERVFGIKIPDEETSSVVTVGDVINGLAKRLGVEEEAKEQEHAELRDSRQIALMIENGRRSGVIEGRKQVVDNPEEYGLCKSAEWSEGDEGMLKCIIATLCEESHGGREANDKMVTWLENRLKSLCPQPHWKPSEEQMKMLESLPDLLREFKLDTSAQMLEVLCEQLKKL